jgi:hypothetical protein
MIAPTPQQAEQFAERLVARAREMLANPNDLRLRHSFQVAVFNLDWCAAAIVALVDKPEVT